MASKDWEDPESHFLALILTAPSRRGSGIDRVAVLINRNAGRIAVHLPPAGRRFKWEHALSSKPVRESGKLIELPAHCVAVFTAV